MGFGFSIEIRISVLALYSWPSSERKSLEARLELVSPQAGQSVEEVTGASSSELFVQDHAAEATVDRHFSTVVFDKAKLPELIHELIDP
jgi:hypothetical protein